MIYAYLFSLDIKETATASPVTVIENDMAEFPYEVKRIRQDMTEQERLDMGPNWRAMKKCAKDPRLQRRHGQPPFPAYTTYMKLATVVKEFDLQCTRFCALADGPGSMSCYLLAKFPASTGVGITLRDEDKSWAWMPSLQDDPRFTSLEGDINATDTIKRLGKDFDFCVADGGMQEKENQEVEATGLLMREVWIAISILRPGGTFVMKIYDTLTDESHLMLWALAHCFETVQVTHGITLRPNNAERYLLCQNLRKDRMHLTDEYSHSFVAFMVAQNKRSYDLQLTCRIAHELQLVSFPETGTEEYVKNYIENL